MAVQQTTEYSETTIPSEGAALPADLAMPPRARGLVVFAHGSGSSRHSKRNRFVAEQLNDQGLGTLLFDLLTDEEDQADRRTRELRFNIPFLASRLTDAVDWLGHYGPTERMQVGLFGASTGAAAALVTASLRADVIRAVVSRGGRPDLAADSLSDVHAPTLLIVGGNDTAVIEMNREAAERLTCEHATEIVAGASHLFEEPGKLDDVAELAARWFCAHLLPPEA